MIYTVKSSDKRCFYIDEYLSKKNIKTLNNILVLPVTGIDENGIIKKTTTSILELIHIYKINIIYTGLIHDKLKQICKEFKIELKSYLNNNTLTLKNAYLTGEGVISKIVDTLDTGIYFSKILILGYGRCGSVIASQFKPLTKDIKIYARNIKDQDKIKINGFELSSLTEIEDRDIIINTIPFKIIDEQFLKKTKKGVYILDIASGKGGVDTEYAKNHNINTFQYLAIPGHVSPKSSGYLIGEVIYNDLHDKT